MGPKASKQPTNWANQDQAYPTNVRLYTAWTHQGASVSHNHTSLRSTSAHANRHGPSSSSSSAPAPSRPVDQQPILVNSSQRKNSDMTSMFSKHNASPLVRPRPPAVHANTRGKELGVRRSRSMNQLSTESKVITVQQLFEDQAKRRKKHGSKSSTHSSPTRNLMKSSSSTTVNQLHSLQTAAAMAKAKKKIPSDLQLALISPSDLKVEHLFPSRINDWFDRLSFIRVASRSSLFANRSSGRSAQADSARCCIVCTKALVMWP